MKLLLLCKFLLIVFSTAANDSLFFTKAKNLYLQAEFELAALEFERVIFLTNSAETKNSALLYKYYCEKEAGQYEKALKSLSRFDLQKIPDSTAFEVKYQKALCNYLTGDFFAAESELLQIAYAFDSSYTSNNYYLSLHILTLNEQGKWLEAKEIFEYFLKKNNLPADSLHLYSFLDDKKFFKSERLARRLSLVLPGSGQVYAGHPWRGLASFTLQVSSASFMIYAFSSSYYLMGISTTFPLLLAFYTGGLRHAIFLVKDHNIKIKQEINQQIKKSLLSLSSPS